MAERVVPNATSQNSINTRQNNLNMVIRQLGADYVPFHVAAGRNEIADRDAAVNLVAARGAVGVIAMALTGTARVAAELACFIGADLVPFRVAAEIINKADGAAAIEIVAEGRTVGLVAATGIRGTACRGAQQRRGRHRQD